MNILFYRYGSICEPDMINAFRKLHIEVIEENAEVTDKALTGTRQVAIVHADLEKYHPLFVFSINFFPAVAEVCHIHQTLYLCWTVDCPVLELFSSSLQYPTNRIFLFDRAQYNYFAPYNPECIFHLPLSSAAERFDQVTGSLPAAAQAKYSHDISFVGSLYNEKNPLRRIDSLPEYVSGYIRGMVEASLKVYGYNFMEEIITPDIVQAIKKGDPLFYHIDSTICDPDSYVAAHEYIGAQAAETERIRTLNTLAQYFTVDLYTRSNTDALQNVRVHPGVASLTEMPQIFHLSKINLNMTIKPIQTGLPLRIFDILGCGGFLITNYQAELTDLFEIGVDLEAYSSMEELVDKCAYYLEHDEQRRRIAENGYEKVKRDHTYEKRITEMIRCINSSSATPSA